jgi:hypothetical protein
MTAVMWLAAMLRSLMLRAAARSRHDQPPSPTRIDGAGRLGSARACAPVAVDERGVLLHLHKARAVHDDGGELDHVCAGPARAHRPRRARAHEGGGAHRGAAPWSRCPARPAGARAPSCPPCCFRPLVKARCSKVAQRVYQSDLDQTAHDREDVARECTRACQCPDRSSRTLRKRSVRYGRNLLPELGWLIRSPSTRGVSVRRAVRGRDRGPASWIAAAPRAPPPRQPLRAPGRCAPQCCAALLSEQFLQSSAHAHPARGDERGKSLAARAALIL